ncbi:hypothetical protein GW17_00014746 [Ensete ventricosum]|nr:hypothetical protein GW17_00014746 [Ensete ventricosum]
MGFFLDRLFPFFLFCLLACPAAHGQLSPTFYAGSCPNLESIVGSVMTQAVAKENRMGASILRLFFHDCFVNVSARFIVSMPSFLESTASFVEADVLFYHQGCDASVLLDDTATFTGEKNAIPNTGSLRGYEVIDAIKTSVEAACAATVSQNAANTDIPAPFHNLSQLISLFVSKGFSAQDMTALSGAHTIGQARCLNFRQHVYNDANVDGSFAALRRQGCPSVGGDDNLAPLDLQSPEAFDNLYYQNLMLDKGLLHSDQELFNGGSQDSVVMTYSTNAAAFKSDFVAAILKMGNMSPLTGTSGEIRFNCRRVNF